MAERCDLLKRIEAILVWAAAFAFASGLFLSLTLLFKALPPTSPASPAAV